MSYDLPDHTNDRDDFHNFIEHNYHHDTEPPLIPRPWAIAGACAASIATGAGITALWNTTQPEPETTEVAVYTCAEQYEQIAQELDAMVTEGVSAGQADGLDVNWIHSVQERQQAYSHRLDDLRTECIDQ